MHYSVSYCALSSLILCTIQFYTVHYPVLYCSLSSSIQCTIQSCIAHCPVLYCALSSLILRTVQSYTVHYPVLYCTLSSLILCTIQSYIVHYPAESALHFTLADQFIPTPSLCPHNQTYNSGIIRWKMLHNVRSYIAWYTVLGI